VRHPVGPDRRPVLGADGRACSWSPVVPHPHAEGTELSFVRQGRIGARVGDRDVTVDGGDHGVHPPGRARTLLRRARAGEARRAAHPHRTHRAHRAPRPPAPTEPIPELATPTAYTRGRRGRSATERLSRQTRDAPQRALWRQPAPERSHGLRFRVERSRLRRGPSRSRLGRPPSAPMDCAQTCASLWRSRRQRRRVRRTCSSSNSGARPSRTWRLLLPQCDSYHPGSTGSVGPRKAQGGEVMQRGRTPASSPDRASRADDQDQEQLSRLKDVFDHLGEVAPMSIEGSPRHTG
jgi:hypothetical protein